MAAQPREESRSSSRKIAREVVVINAGAITQAGGPGGLERINADERADAKLAGELAHGPGARTEIEQHDLGRVHPEPSQGASESIDRGLRRAAFKDVLDDVFIESRDA